MNKSLEALERICKVKIYQKEASAYDYLGKEIYKEEINAIKQELERLEEIEKELGCSLEVVFKAFKEGTIEDEDGGIQIVGITIGGDGELYLHAINGDLYLLKDYQKTWWLKGDGSE